MIEMLICTIILFTFVLTLFIVGAGYWNDTLLHSTSQNASLTAQSDFDADLRTTNLSTIESECQKTTSTTAVVAAECPGGLINPWHAVQSVVAGSSEYLMLVPKAREGECLQWWQPPKEEKFKSEGPIVLERGERSAVGNSSWDTGFALNEAESGGVRATNVSVYAPFRPFPLFEGAHRAADTCSTAVTITANSVALGYLP